MTPLPSTAIWAHSVWVLFLIPPPCTLEHPPSGLCIAPPSGTLSPSLGSPLRSCAGVTRPVELLLSVLHPGPPSGKQRFPPGFLGTLCDLCWGQGFSRGLRQPRGQWGGPHLVAVGCKASRGISTHRVGTQDLQLSPGTEPRPHIYLSLEPQSVHL